MGFYYFSTTSLLWWWNLPLFMGWNPYKLLEPMEKMCFLLCSAFWGRLTVTSHPGPSFGMIVQCFKWNGRWIHKKTSLRDHRKGPLDHEITPCSSNQCLWTAHLNQRLFLPHQDGSKTPKSVASSRDQSPKVPFCFGCLPDGIFSEERKSI